jgi:hypothetical protein
MMMRTLVAFTVVLAGVASPAHARQTQAPPAGESSSDLAKKLSNPVSSLVSVPLQFNWESPVGPEDDTRFILNFQPVMPFSLNDKWNAITRVIIPIVGQPALSGGGVAASGIGDVLVSMFFSPAEPGAFIWGVGPVVSLPSTNELTLGTQKWSAGPTALVLKQTGPWTYGVLWNQVWSFAGNKTRSDVNQMFVQPFMSYTTSKAISLTVNSESVGNFEADGDRWTVPLNFQITKVLSFGPFPASYGVAYGVYLAGPDSAPSWKLRGLITVLLPRTR